MGLLKNTVKSGFEKVGLDVRRAMRPHDVKQRPQEEIRLIDFLKTALQQIEDSLDHTATRSDLFSRLRVLGLGDFGLFLLSIPNSSFPKMSALLPRMAAADVQLHWTGSSGVSLYTQTLAFVQAVAYKYTAITGRSLENATILDYGCGYGRITRLMYYFSNEENVFGVDPWEKSVEICRADGISRNIMLSERLPSQLPVPVANFDLIFAYSVFTHLSEKGTITCLNTLADYVRPGGLLVITIRPLEYWDVDKYANELGLVEQQKEVHRREGFSFLAHHDSAVVDGHKTYGDTSLTLDWLQRSVTTLRIMGVERSPSDPSQIYVFLQRA